MMRKSAKADFRVRDALLRSVPHHEGREKLRVRHASSPVFFGRPRAGPRRIAILDPRRGERSAGRRGGLRGPRWAVGETTRVGRLAKRPVPPCDRRNAPSGAPHPDKLAQSGLFERRFLSPWAVLPGNDKSRFRLRVQERWPPLRHRCNVQPSKAAGRDAGGRLARASRDSAYEAEPRAPHRPTAGVTPVSPIRRDDKAASPASSPTAASSSARLRRRPSSSRTKDHMHII